MKRIVIVTEEHSDGDTGVQGIYTDSTAPFEVVTITVSYDEYTDDEGQPYETLSSAIAGRRTFRPLSQMPRDARRAWLQYLRKARAGQPVPGR